VDAFNKNGNKLVVATNTDNKLYRSLREKSKSNIEWMFDLPREEIRDLFSRAKAFLFPPEEDFGIVPIEAMACGTPVIAYGKWWALETVVDWKTGIFFSEQTSDSLNESIKVFEQLEFDAKKIREHAEKFDKSVFRKKLLEFVEDRV